MQEPKKYKMIIVDDEYLVRLGIKETIDWQNYNIEVVAEGKNGKQGLELIKEYQPDIVISDIKMPVMDGLDLVKAIEEQNLDTCIIMLSGYKDFEYAKEALENGAYQYLLKPIDNQKLVESVLAGIKHIEQKRSNLKKLNNIENDYTIIKNSIIHAILLNKYDNQKTKELIENYQLGISNYGLVVFIKADEGKFDNNELENIINNILRDEHLTFNSLSSKEQYIYIINDISTNSIEPLFHRILDLYIMTETETISIGISDNYHKFDDIGVKYQQAKNLTEDKIFKSISTIVTTKANGKHYHQTVIEGLKYIATNYDKNISIKTCSEYLLVSESHLMHVFKEDLNKTFNNYLTEYRMLVAKNLINQNKYKIYEISDKVGISDTKYFSQLFKKVYGVTPMEYRDSRYEK